MTRQPDEVLFSDRTHAKILVGPIIIQALLLTAHLIVHNHLSDFENETADTWVPLVLHSIIGLISLIYVIVPALRWSLTRFTITTTHVAMQWGVLNRQYRKVPLAAISQVEMERSLIDRIFGCGTIWLHVAGNDKAVMLVDVPKVNAARELIDQLSGTGRQALHG